MAKLCLSIQEAAASTSLSRWTIKAYIRMGKIKSFRIGRRVMIRPRDLRAFVQKNQSAGREVTAGK